MTLSSFERNVKDTYSYACHHVETGDESAGGVRGVQGDLRIPARARRPSILIDADLGSGSRKVEQS